MRKYNLPDQFWFGDENSYEVAAQVYCDMMAGIFGGTPTQKPASNEEQPLPHLLSVHGNVGVISIAGSLVNIDSPYLRYAKGYVTSYHDIKRAAVHAAGMADIKGILLDVNSGGGAANGAADTGTLMREINDQVKPVLTFTDGTMASAALWIGLSAGNVYASSTASVGSIGVLQVLMEASKANEQAGLTVKVVRAGKYKALNNPHEPFTKEGLDQAQSQADALYAEFIGQVADMRGVTVAQADEKMGQGRVFIGKQAADVGLVDGISKYGVILGAFQSKLQSRLENA